MADLQVGEKSEMNLSKTTMGVQHVAETMI
jgi:hypothetical protein